MLAGPLSRRAPALSPSKGVGGPYAPPAGYRWAYVTENGATVTEDGSPLVELERTS